MDYGKYRQYNLLLISLLLIGGVLLSVSEKLYANSRNSKDNIIIDENSLFKYNCADSLYNIYERTLHEHSLDSLKLYSRLKECVDAYSDVLVDTIKTFHNEAKSKLRELHPHLIEGGVYCSNRGDVPLAIDLLERYIMLPKSDYFSDAEFDMQHDISECIYFVAANKYNSKKFDEAITLFNDYLNQSNNSLHEQEVYYYLAKCYEYVGLRDYQIYTLMRGVQKYPQDVNLYKEVIEYHIDTNNANQAEYYLISYEKLKVNPLELLSLRAKVAEIKGDYYQFMLLSQQLYEANSRDINSIALFGRASYNYVIDEMKNGKKDVNGNPTSDLVPYLNTASQMFELAIEKNPKEKRFYDALIDTYSLLGQKSLALNVAEKLKVLMGYSEKDGLVSSDTTSLQVGAKGGVVQVEEVQIQKPTMTSYGAPYFSLYVQDYMNENLNIWLQKGTFEKTVDYNERINGISRRNKERELISEAKRRYIKMYSGNVANQVRDINLIDYDADNETFLIKYALGNMLIRVPLKDGQAQNFKNDWANRQVRPTNPQFDVVGDTIMLTGLTFNSFNTGLSYDYSINNQLSYVKANVKIDPTPITAFDILKESGNKGVGVTIYDESKLSDVDIDVPKVSDSLKNEMIFALIISNENYDNADKVHHAINDGSSMKIYCESVLGIPSKNIQFFVDASYGKMLKEIEVFINILKEAGPEARGVVYYSGHGLPNVETGEAYFLPKDGIPESLEFAIPINFLYNSLAETSIKRIDVFLDCCFSGNSKSGQHLYAARGTVIKPRTNAPKGNMIVLSACSGNETAFQYDDQRHGLFTYYLLKKLKETSGNVTMGELADYIIKNVHRMSMLNNKKYQTPNVISSDGLSASWKSLMVR